MEIPIKGIPETIHTTRRYYYSPTGLLMSVLLCTALTESVFWLLNPLMTGLTETPLSFLSGSVFHLITLATVVGTVGVLWLLKRRIPRFRVTEAGVLFGPVSQTDVVQELRDLEERLKTLVIEKDMTNIIKIKRLPPNQRTGNHERKIAILSKARAKLLICGNFEKCTVKGKEITGFTSLTISVAHLPVTPQHLPYLLSDAISPRQWIWDSENTIHKNVVAENLGEVSRYVVGLSLIVQQRHTEAQKVLGPLFADVNAKHSSNHLPVEIRRFKATVANAYSISITSEVGCKYSQALEQQSLFAIPLSELHRYANQLKDSLHIWKQNPRALLLLAVFEFLLGDVKASKKSVQEAGLFLPVQHRMPCLLSEAFLLSFGGELREARKLYRQIIEGMPDQKTIRGVLDFLDQAISAFPEKPQIRFVFALLNDEFEDKLLAAREFEKFIIAAKNKSGMEKWIREAELRMRRMHGEETAEVSHVMTA